MFPELPLSLRIADLEFYRKETQTQLQFNKYLKAGTVGRNYSNILVLLLRLRQACCHPHLIKDFGQASGATEVSPDDILKLAQELKPDVVARIKQACESNDDLALVSIHLSICPLFRSVVRALCYISIAYFCLHLIHVRSVS